MPETWATSALYLEAANLRLPAVEEKEEMAATELEGGAWSWRSGRVGGGSVRGDREGILEKDIEFEVGILKSTWEFVR